SGSATRAGRWKSSLGRAMAAGRKRVKPPAPAWRNLERTMASLEGKVAVVTGASRGIGAAAARALAREGAAVALLARSEEACQALAAEIDASGGRAIAVGGDVSDGAQVAAASRAVREGLGRVDILINNAGV